MERNKNLQKIKFNSKIFLLLFFLIASMLFFAAHSLHAQTVSTYQSQEKIPGAGGQAVDFISYLRQVIGFGYATIGILAMFMLSVGAYQYLMAAGNLSKAENAKNTISSAILGLILGLMSYVILWTINPDLVSLRGINLSGLQIINTSPGTTVSTGTAGGTVGTTAGNGSGGQSVGVGAVSSGQETLDQVAQNLQDHTVYVNYSLPQNANAPRGWVNGTFYGDCSSWAQEFYKEAYGINPGGSTVDMLQNVNSTDVSNLKAGDLLIMTGGGQNSMHAGIYMDTGQNLVISNSGTGVNVVYSQLKQSRILGIIVPSS